ncbi:MAG TPA: transcriptional regulator [Methanosarcinaceae archaeon]|nr:transcriptional regulator [Methanosarcinaceae archaeon]
MGIGLELHLYRKKTTNTKEKTIADNEQKVIDAIKEAGEPLRSGDIADRIGIDKKEIGKIINALKKKGQVSSPKRCYYAPPE